MKHKNMCYDNRYKYKLNMLEPGIIMMKIVGALFVFGIIFWVAKQRWLSAMFLFLSGIIFTVLLILVAIEAHQDKVLNDIAIRENMCPDMHFEIMAKMESAPISAWFNCRRKGHR